MKPDKIKRCEEFETLLVKKITGELVPEEKAALESHLAECETCESAEQAITKTWKCMDSLEVRDIPIELYENTRERVLGRLTREKKTSPWYLRIHLKDMRLQGVTIVAGLVMTALSYALVENLIDLRIHQYRILIPLFTLWAILLITCCGLIFTRKIERSLSLNIVATFSISATFLALFISRLASEADLVARIQTSAVYDSLSRQLSGLESMFILGWGSYACLASFIGAFLIGLHKGPYLPKNVFLGSILISVLLFPAIYLQGSSHGHGLGILAFAGFGTFVGALVGTGVGFFTRRKVLPALA